MMVSPVDVDDKAFAWVPATPGGSTPGSVTMAFDNNTITNEQVDVVAGTPVASEAKYFTITPTGSVEKYSIYVQTSSSSNGSLVGSSANNATIATLADKTTGVALNSIGTNTWGYALETGRKTTDSMMYKGISGSTNAVSAYDSVNNPTTAQDFTLAFAANIGNDKPADHYVANVVVSVAANPGEVTNLYSVSYNTNNSTGGVTPATQIAESNSSTYTFVAPMGEDLAKTGYGFAGWSESASATTVQYKPGSVIALSTASPTKTLYAVWTRTIQNVTDMTELTPLGCSTSKENETKQLKDTRDSKTYWVTKLKDGNCWMVQNLDYDDPASTKVTNPSSWTSTSNTYRAYYDPGLKVVSGSSLVDAGSSDTHLLVGNYYSWQSATNGTGSSATTAGAVASDSICPGGWKLPTSNNTDKGSFGGLTSGISAGSTLVASPYYFQYGGGVWSGYLNNAGGKGYYWSSTAEDGANAYNLYFTSSSVNPSLTYNRYFALSVRCLVQVPEEITYTLSYDIRGGSNPPATQTVTTSADSYTFTVANGDTVTPPASSAFLGWSTAGNYPSYASGSTITLTKDEPNKTLYAVWGYLGLD